MVACENVRTRTIPPGFPLSGVTLAHSLSTSMPVRWLHSDCAVGGTQRATHGMALWSARLSSVFLFLALFPHDLGVTGQL
jgi:hypothetical protein